MDHSQGIEDFNSIYYCSNKSKTTPRMFSGFHIFPRPRNTMNLNFSLKCFFFSFVAFLFLIATSLSTSVGFALPLASQLLTFLFFWLRAFVLGLRRKWIKFMKNLNSAWRKKKTFIFVYLENESNSSLILSLTIN